MLGFVCVLPETFSIAFHFLTRALNTFESFTDQQASKLLTSGFRCELALAHAAAAGSLVPLLCLLNAHVQLEYHLGSGLFSQCQIGSQFSV